MAHAGGKWDVIYKNRDSKVNAGVTEGERKYMHKNMHIYKLNIQALF